jgi:MFS family permease
MSTTETETETRVGVALDNVGLTRAHRLILFCVMAGGFFDVFEQNAPGVTGPSLQALWHLTTTQIGFAASATYGSMVVGGVATGILSDRAGRKTLFSFNLGIYSLGGLICAFAPNFQILIIGRIIVGLGLGGELTIALPFLSELMPTKFRGTAVSLFNMGAGGLGNPAAFAFGSLIIGVLGPVLGGMGGSWRWYFGLLALPALIVLYVRRHLPETPRFLVSKGRISEANRALSVLASGHLNAKNLTVTKYLDESAKTDVATGASHAGGYDIKDVFRGRLRVNTVTLGLGAFMSFGGQLVALTMIPIILVSRGYSIGNSLGFTAVMQGGALLGTVVAAYLNHRLPRRLVVVPAAILAGIFGVVFALLGTTIATIIVFGFIFNFFVLLCNTTLWAWAPEVYPTRVRATGTGIIVNTGLAGQAVMPPVAAVLLSASGIFVMFALVAAMYAVLAVLAFFAPETFGRDLEELHGEV